MGRVEEVVAGRGRRESISGLGKPLGGGMAAWFLPATGYSILLTILVMGPGASQFGVLWTNHSLLDSLVWAFEPTTFPLGN